MQRISETLKIYIANEWQLQCDYVILDLRFISEYNLFDFDRITNSGNEFRQVYRQE